MTKATFKKSHVPQSWYLRKFAVFFRRPSAMTLNSVNTNKTMVTRRFMTALSVTDCHGHGRTIYNTVTFASGHNLCDISSTGRRYVTKSFRSYVLGKENTPI